MSSSPQSFLRQRNLTATPKAAPPSLPNESQSPEALGTSTRSKRDEVVWGKTPSGELFRVPTTHDVLTALFHPKYPKSHFDLLNLGLLGLQLVLFFVLPRSISKSFFLFYFTFWRASYDAGLGWILTKQSKKKWIVREVQKLGWFDEKRKPSVRNWIRAQLIGKMGKDYSFDELPLEYNTWLLFRQVVDVILLNDFLAYCMFAFSSFRVPDGLPLPVHIMRWIGGIALILFNLWVKTEAHNVVKDYAWYWGDVFFHQFSHLIFDGVFELAPHPMYSVGYAGYYGLSLIVGSYSVLFVSLAAHAAQFAFLVFFENPHIERRYGQRKLIAQRTPIQSTRSHSRATTPVLRDDSPPLLSRLDNDTSAYLTDVSTSTPAATEGETATESDALDTDTEIESDSTMSKVVMPKSGSPPKRTASLVDKEARKHKARSISQHDLVNKYFRRDAVLLYNIDLFRTSDYMLLLIIAYPMIFSMLPQLSTPTIVALHFAHACAWCLFHCIGLGLLLQAQSRNKFIVRHFLKNYYYPPNDRGEGAIQEAFSNWKSLYNLSLCMTYTSFVGLVWKTYSIPQDWTVGNELLRHTLGGLLVGLHVWAAMESYEALGAFSWFYGDFFMEDFPSHLEYTGIYRYLDNPEVMGGAAFFGLALVSGSKFAFTIAAIRYLSNWWFLSKVENPHMKKLYGDSLRKEAGFVKVIKNVASKNVRILESRAGRHGPEIRRVAREVKGTFEKVYDETADAVEEFLTKSGPTRRLSEVMEDTKVLLQQSRERLVITRLANDLSSYETTKYKVSVVPPTPNGTSLRFHLGEQIKIHWQAPYSHSRRDWIGIYRVGANKSNLVTKTASLGCWAPVHDDEWDGDIPLDLDRPPSPGKDSQGEVVFKGDTLPWQVGKYEVRYHHDGKYNVLSLDGPLEIYVDKPSSLNFEAIRKSLKRIVTLCLDSDPSLIPASCRMAGMMVSLGTEDRDPDDFSFWSERQARRISGAIKQAFDVEYAPEVVVADANLTALANRILVSREILSD